MATASRPGSMLRGAVLAAALLAPGTAPAQAWKPAKPLEVVVGLSAGSSQDRTGRTLQRVWQERNLPGTPSAVVNRVGGGGQVAWTFMAQHAGAPHYVQVASPTIVTGHVTGLSRFAWSDFTPVALLGSQYVGVAVRPESALRSGRDLIAQLRRDPAATSLAVNSAGSTPHMLAGLLVKAAGGDPRRGRIPVFQGGELMTAGIGGHVDCIVTVTSNIVPHVRADRLRMLAVAAPRRLGGALAGTPTWRESDVDAVLAVWTSLFAPRQITAAQVAWWDGLLAATIATPEWKAFMDPDVWEAEYLNAADFTKFLRADEPKQRAALADLGLARP